jgi:transposase/transposase-like protein
MAKFYPIALTQDELTQLAATTRSTTAALRDVRRARIVLMSAQGCANREIARKLEISPNSVSFWRRRFVQEGLAGLQERPGRGRQRTYGSDMVEAIINTTLQTTPKAATHWSTRSLAKNLGVSHATVQRVWATHRIKPHLCKTFKLSTDKHFAEKVKDVVGLYLNPPEHALVLSVDEKTSIQALDRSQPGLPIKKGRCGTMTHDYKRYGTTTLFAALNVLEGTVLHKCMDRHRHQEFLKFLRLIDRATPKLLDLHLIVDNYATHKHANVKEWLVKHPRFHLHFIPTSSSWLSMVERCFRDLTEKRLRRGIFRSVMSLVLAIDEYLEVFNDNPKPFIWTKSADEILNKLAPLYAPNGFKVICETLH